MATANIREVTSAISYRKQTAFGTKPGAGNYVAFARTNAALMNLSLVSEDDAQDIGKGDEFANTTYPTNWDTSVPFEKYLTSQFAAFVFAFGLGKTTKTTPEAGAFTYTCVPLPPLTDGIDMPLFTYAEAIRPGGSALFDRAALDCVVEDFSISLTSGPGRQNARIAMNAVGSGRYESPFGVTYPSALVEGGLNAGSAAITIHGDNYVNLRRVVSLEIGWKNSMRLEQGFYPGSGSANGASVRGRLEHGDREATLRFTVRLENGSTELTKLQNQSEGTAVVTLTGANIGATSTPHSISCTFHRITYKQATIADDQGIVTVQCEASVKKHATNGLVTFAATTDLDNILTNAA